MELQNNFYKLRKFLSFDQNRKFNFFIFLSVLAMIFEILSISIIVPLINIFVQGNTDIPLLSFNYKPEITIFIFLYFFLSIFTIKNLFLIFF